MSLSDPASGFFAITPDNSTNFTQGECRGIYVGGGGDIAAVSASGEVVTFVAVPTGQILPIRAVRVNVTNTDATNLVGLYR